MHSTTAFVNDLYLRRKDDFPIQVAALKALQEKNLRRGFNTDVKPIVIMGRDTEEIISNIANSIRSVMRCFHDGSVVSFMGDGPSPLLFNAINRNFEDNPVTKDLNDTPHPIIMAPGGTMNLLSRTLGTNSLDTVVAMATGAITPESQEIKLRNLTTRTYDEKGQQLKATEYPWVALAGGRVDGLIMQEMEQQPRSTKQIIRMVRAGAKSILHVMSYRGGHNVPAFVKDKMPQQVGTISYMTIPYLGPFRFDEKNYNRLDSNQITKFFLEGNSGLEGSAKWATFAVLGFNPEFGQKIWEKMEATKGKTGIPWYHIRESLANCKPWTVDSDLVYHSASDPFMQVDGTPIDMRRNGLKTGGFATSLVETTDKSFTAARMPTNITFFN